MTQSVMGVRQALYAACVGLYPETDALISYGDPGNYQPDAIVALGQTRTVVSTPTMAPVRTTEQTVETDVVISIYVHGGVDAQLPAEQRMQDYTDRLRNYFRTKPNDELGGACRTSRVTAQTFDQDVSWEEVDGMDPVAAGRTAIGTITITSFVRT